MASKHFKKNKCGGRTCRVRVTRDNIMNGQTHSGEYCAIALALSEVGFQSPNVDDEEITLIDPDTEKEFEVVTPTKLAKFIEAFDATEQAKLRVDPYDDDYKAQVEAAQERARKRLKPFSFEIILPGPASIRA